MNLLLPTGLAVLGLLSGIGLGREWEKVYPTTPVPRYAQFDCWQEQRHREPWELYPDGQVVQVGNWHYLVAPRERVISKAKPKYDGNAVYLSMVKIEDLDRHTTKTVCPKGW